MPYFTGVTPVTSSEPITISAVDGGGNTRRVQSNLPVNVVATAVLVEAFVDAKMELSNMGMFKWRGTGQSRQISRVDATVNNELFGVGTTMLVRFVNTDSPEDFFYDRIPAPNAGYLEGYSLRAPTLEAAINAYIIAAQNLLNTGGVTTWVYESSNLEGEDAEVRVIPLAMEEPTGVEGDPAQP